MANLINFQLNFYQKIVSFSSRVPKSHFFSNLSSSFSFIFPPSSSFFFCYFVVYLGVTTLRIRSCFVFGRSTEHVELIDRHGCPTSNALIEQFHYNDSSTGEATIPAMFKFSDEPKVNFQCDAIICRDGCDEPICDLKRTQEQPEVELDGYIQVSASTSALIREPTGESGSKFFFLPYF